MASSSTFESLGGTAEASEFGASLRDMRVAHNTDVSTVASTLRIRQVYLQAIEDGRFDDLPGPTYAAGFIRAYAEYLGLDVAETMQRYRDVTGNASGQAPLVAPSPVVEGRVPTGFILLVAAVLAATAYGSWYYLSLNGRDAGDVVAKLPERIANMVGLSTEEADPVAAPKSAMNAPEKAESRTSSATDEIAARKAAAEEPAAEKPAAANPPVAVKPSMPAPALEIAATSEAAPVVTASVSPSTAIQPDTDTPRQTTGPAAGDRAADAATPERTPERTPATVTARDPAPPANESPVARPAAVTANVEPVANTVTDQAETPASAERTEDVSVSTLVPQQAALPEPPATVAVNAISRVVLRATAISWVELRDVAGKRVFSRLLKKGEIYNVPAQSGITLATGNAGALDILVDGQVISPIGPAGSVRRDVLLEPAALLARSTGSR